MKLFDKIRAFFFPSKKGRPGVSACTYCGSLDFYGGPSGGMSTNIMCANPDCGHWFNWHQGILPMDDLHQIGPDRRPG